jgi:hypothetical protein
MNYLLILLFSVAILSGCSSPTTTDKQANESAIQDTEINNSAHSQKANKESPTLLNKQAPIENPILDKSDEDNMPRLD